MKWKLFLFGPDQDDKERGMKKEKEIVWFCFYLLLLLAGLFPRAALSFYCNTSSQSYAITTTGLGTTGASAQSPAFSTYCSGTATSYQYDALRINSFTPNSIFTSRGFTVDVSVGGGSWANPTNTCIWPSSNTGYNCGGSSMSDSGNTRSIAVRVRRTGTGSFTTIPAGTTIATIVIWQRSNNTWSGSGGWWQITLTYYSNSAINPSIPTCAINSFDESVILPPVSRTDLVSHGIGRYTAATKEFNINLKECKDKPKISVKYTGDTMTGTGTDTVLANKTSGNDNVGIQIFYNGSAIKIGDKLTTITSTQANENLKFNSYYYFKGGAVSAGPIQSNAEFTMSYE